MALVTWEHFARSEKREEDRLFRLVTASNDPHQEERAMSKFDEWQRGAAGRRRRHRRYLRRIADTAESKVDREAARAELDRNADA